MRGGRWGGIAFLPLLLMGCGGPEPAPGGVTADDARELNEAAAMLDANSVDLNAVTGNEEEPR